MIAELAMALALPNESQYWIFTSATCYDYFLLFEFKNCFYTEMNIDSLTDATF